MRRIRTSLQSGGIAPALALFALSMVPLHATSAYSSGFEGPTYTIGQLDGQDGWSIFNPGAGLTTVVNSIVKTGTQAAGVVNGQNPVGQSGPFHSDSITGTLVELSADIYLASSSNQTRWQFAGTGGTFAQYLGGIDVLPDNSVVLVTQGFPLAGVFTRDVWHHVDLRFDMTAQTYNFALDGLLLATGVPFCGDHEPCTNKMVVPNYGLGTFNMFANFGINDAGYMDNFSANSINSVPEPSTLFLIGAGLAVMAMRRLAASAKA